MSPKTVGVEPKNETKFDDDLCYLESDNALFPEYDLNNVSGWRHTEESTSVKRRIRPAWRLIEDYKEELRLKRELEEIDSDPFTAA